MRTSGASRLESVCEWLLISRSSVLEVSSSVMPSKRRRRAAADPPKTTAAFEIPEEERFRIIEETGILDDPPAAGPSTEPLLSFSDDELVDKPGLDEEDAEVEEEDTLPVWVDSACDTFMFLIPFTSLFIVMSDPPACALTRDRMPSAGTFSYTSSTVRPSRLSSPLDVSSTSCPAWPSSSTTPCATLRTG